MINPKIDFTELNTDDIIPKTYSDWVLNSAGHIQVENTDDPPKINSQITTKRVYDEFSLDDFDWNQFSPFTEHVDAMIRHETGLIEKVMFDEFRANGYDTPEKVKYLFEVDWYMLSRMMENVNYILRTYYEYGVIHSCDTFLAPIMPIKISDEVFTHIRERMEFLYGTDTE